MALPFTTDAFFEVFARYNVAVWRVMVALSGILTTGLLLTTARRPPIPVVVVPVLWALIGGSAALVLGVTTDYVLLACSVLLIVDTIRKAPGRA